jgi:hypothetical protein
MNSGPVRDIPMRRGATIGTTRGRILALVETGRLSVAQIARRLGLNPRTVRDHLVRAGICPAVHYAVRRKGAERAARQRFARLWNAAPNRAAAAGAVGMTIQGATERASRLRRLYGMKLKKFPSGRPKGTGRRRK